MSKPRLLFVSAYPEPAAISRYVSGDVALHLKDRGWRCLLTSRSPSRWGRVLDIGWNVWKQRGEYEVACVDVFSGSAFLWAELACGILRRLGKPFILTLHGGSLPEFARKNPGRVRRLLEQSPIVTSPSTYLATELKDYRAGIRVVPNPLEVSRYPYRVPAARMSRVVWLRAFHAIYNPALAVQCIAEARKQGVDLQLDMYGPDKGDGSRAAVEAAMLACGVCDRVTLHGMVPKERIPETMASGDLFLNTTNFDNTPVSVLEAMACGLPVVTTRVGGIPYLLKDGWTALLVPPGDPVSMASALCRVVGDRVLAHSLAHQGRQLVEEFDWNRVLGVWEGLLGEIDSKK